MNKENISWEEAQGLIRQGWSEWHLLCYESTADLPERPGAYEVRFKNYSFPRLRGMTNTLYIGCTDKRGVRKRLRSLIKGRHIARKRIRKITDELQKELEFRYKVTFLAKQTEAELLREYEEKHLELPPCNHITQVTSSLHPKNSLKSPGSKPYRLVYCFALRARLRPGFFLSLTRESLVSNPFWRSTGLRLSSASTRERAIP